MFRLIAPYLGPILILAMVFWRIRRQSMGRRVKPSRLWIRPAILAIFLGFSFLHSPPFTAYGGAILLLAAALGLGAGYYLARHQHLTIDPATGAITSKMSPVGIALFLGLFAARYVFRAVTTGGQAPNKLMAHSGQIMLYTDAGLVFILALVGAQAWEIWRRAKPLLDGHAAAKRAESLAE